MCEKSSLIPDDELKWTSKELFYEILKNYTPKNKNITLVHHTVEKGTTKGENFLSKLYRLKLYYNVGLDSTITYTEQTHTTSFIVKVAIADEITEELMAEFDIFQREIAVYQTILPECYRILQNNNNVENDSMVFAPKCYVTKPNLIVMEDLAPRKYDTLDRIERLNLEQCKVVLEKLAKFHAATAALNFEKPELFVNHMKGNLTEVETPYNQFFRNAISACVKYIKTVPEFKGYVSKLEELKKHIIEQCLEVFTRDESSFLCLNHGDVWTSNLMFKHRDNEIESLLLIDYQEGYFGSPAIDLNFFIYTSCNLDVLKNHLNELLGHYHKSLKNTLEDINYKLKIPTIEDIKSEIKKKFHHALTSLLCVSPVLTIENPDHSDGLNFVVDTEESLAIRDIVYSNPKVKEILCLLLPRFDQEGLI